MAFLPTIWKIAWCARKYTITIIHYPVGLLPLLPVGKTTEQTTENKHVKEIVDAEARLGALGLFFFSFFSENIGEKEKVCYLYDVFVVCLIICLLCVLSCLCLLSFIFFL